jgi:(1->4)-alpha-D-glucan 1-alpha-D-glucosylmutase
VSVEDFHRENAERLGRWPHAMLATSTHDTKRGEDTRARINVLSEIPDEWQAALRRWSELNAAKKSGVDGKAAPDRNDEYLLYQTLLGAWPAGSNPGAEFGDFRERITTYMLKAIKEAKVHTSWVNPHAEYESAMRNFVARLLPDDPADPFLADFMRLQRRVAFFGYYNSLSQLVLKMASPGVPDFYQGMELWAFTLVDPDNRRPVDYDLRQKLLAELKARAEKDSADLTGLARELLADMSDGRVKLYVTWRGLACRRAHRELFLGGAYQGLTAAGDGAEHVCAFTRSLAGAAVLAAVPRLVVGVTRGKELAPLGLVWGATRLVLPADEAGSKWRNVFTGEVLTAGGLVGEPGLPLAAVFGHFPVALLERVG